MIRYGYIILDTTKSVEEAPVKFYESHHYAQNVADSLSMKTKRKHVAVRVPFVVKGAEMLRSLPLAPEWDHFDY